MHQGVRVAAHIHEALEGGARQQRKQHVLVQASTRWVNHCHNVGVLGGVLLRSDGGEEEWGCWRAQEGKANSEPGRRSTCRGMNNASHTRGNTLLHAHSHIRPYSNTLCT